MAATWDTLEPKPDPKPKIINVGWYCCICKHREDTYKGNRTTAATRMLRHISSEHPDEWADGNWMMTAIKGEK